MHVNPTYMLMKPKKSMWGDFCFVVKISQKFHNIFYFNMIWKKTREKLSMVLVFIVPIVIEIGSTICYYLVVLICSKNLFCK